MNQFFKTFYLLLFLSVGNLIFGADNVTVTINYSVKGTKEGYDHLTKIKVYIDGREVGESTPKNQTIDNAVTVNVLKGNHKLRAVLFAKSGDIWEARTLENNYSLDCIYEKAIDFNNNKVINIVVDLKKLTVMANETTTNTILNNNNNNYTTALKNINDYLKTFDNGYYGYLEIKDGYLYDRFQSGKYCKTPLDKLGKAIVETANRKVVILCKDNSDCVYSTYTDSYHKQMSFSQSTDFNTSTLITLLNNLISVYNNGSNLLNTNIITEQPKGSSAPIGKRKDEIKSDIDDDIDFWDYAFGFSEESKTTNTKYSKQLETLNAFLKTFRPDVYSSVEVKDDKVYFNFIILQEKYNSNISISNLATKATVMPSVAELDVKIQCNNKQKFFYSSYTESTADSFHFYVNRADDNMKKLEQLLNDFINALK